MQIDPVDQVLSRVKNARRIGTDKYMASSPTRRDANPSLSIRRGEDGRCLLHDFGGSTVAEIVDALGMDMNDLFADDKERSSWLPQQTKPKKRYVLPAPPTETTYREGTVKWFAARGISEQTVKQFGIYAIPERRFRKLDKGRGGTGPAICFPYTRNGILVNTKYRSPQVKDFAQEEEAEPVCFNLDGVPKESEEVIIVEGECFPGDAEVLTDEGWTRFDKYQGERLAQWSISETPYGELEMVDPLAIIQKPYRGDLIRNFNQQRFESVTTPGHNLVLRRTKHGTITKRRAETRPTGGYEIPRVALMNGIGVDLDNDQIAFCLAISADAAIRNVKNTWKHKGPENRYVVIGLEKERKIDRLTALLDRLAIQHHRYTAANGQEVFCLPLPSWVPGRLLPHEWLTKLTIEQRRFIINEMVCWDGNRVPNRAQTEYSTKHRENAVFMQTIAHTTGMCSTIIPRKNQWGEWFKVSILHAKTATGWQKSLCQEAIPYEGDVYCAQVPSGMLLVRQNNCITVTGNCDVLAIHEATGQMNVLSPPGGAESFSEAVMDSAAHLLANERVKIVLAGDQDEAGERMMDDLVRRIGKERCFRVHWPEGCKDANDTLVTYGKEAVAKALDAKEPLPVEEIIFVRDLSDDLWQLYTDGLPPGASTGIPSLDKHYTIATGQWTVWTGSPGAGKTTLIDQVMVNLAELYDWTFGICSMENRRLARHLASIAAKRVRKPFREGPRERMSVEELGLAEEWMAEKFGFVRPTEPTIESVLKAARALVYRTGIKGLVIDPWNRIHHPQSMNSGDYVASAINQISEFAYRFDLHVWLVAHPRILQKNAAGQYPIPTLYEISGSAHFFNMADYGISMGRDKDDPYAPSRVEVQKSRFDEIASLGTVMLAFDRATGRFYDTNASEEESPNSITAWHPQTPAERMAAKETEWEGEAVGAAD